MSDLRRFAVLPVLLLAFALVAGCGGDDAPQTKQGFIDDADPTPYWLVSCRRPDRVLAAFDDVLPR